MNRLSSYIITLCFCLLCLFNVVICAGTEIPESTTDVNNKTVDVQQIESPITSPSESLPNNNDPLDGLPGSSLPNNTNNSSMTCHIGECVPCTGLELKFEPYCQEFGNKEPLECEYDIPGDHDTPPLRFQACKRVKSLERTKYLEFQFANIVIAFLSCSILLWRRSKLAADGYKRLSRRIRGNV